MEFEACSLMYPNDLPPDTNWWKPRLKNICQDCGYILSFRNLNLIKSFIFCSERYNESPISYAINEISLCGCCKIEELTFFLISIEVKEQLNLYYSLMNIRRKLILKIYNKKIDKYYEKKSYTDLLQKYENSLLEYQYKYQSFDCKKERLVNSLRRDVSSLKDRSESNIKVKVEIYHFALMNSDHHKEDFDYVPGNIDYQKTKVSFESNIYKIIKKKDLLLKKKVKYKNQNE